MARHVRVILLSLAGLVLAIGSARAQTADEVIEKHLAALGGRDALGKLTSRRATGTVTVSTPAGDVSGPAELLSKAPNKTRASMSLDLSSLGGGQMELVQRFDGVTASASNSMQGDTEITGSMLENMRNNIFPTALLRYKENNLTLEQLPKDTLNGRSVFVIKVTPKTGPAVTLSFDAETYLLARSVVRVSVPQLGTEVDQATDLFDYRTVDGVKVPFRTVVASDVQTVTIVLAKVEHNVPLDDALFARK